MYKLKFHPDVKKELEKLDNSFLLIFHKKLKQILQNPEIGKDLGNVSNLNLSGFKKVYFARKKMRIVYKIERDELIIYIISVGKRENKEVYKNAFRRI